MRAAWPILDVLPNPCVSSAPSRVDTNFLIPEAKHKRLKPLRLHNNISVIDLIGCALLEANGNGTITGRAIKILLGPEINPRRNAEAVLV